MSPFFYNSFTCHDSVEPKPLLTVEQIQHSIQLLRVTSNQVFEFSKAGDSHSDYEEYFPACNHAFPGHGFAVHQENN